MKKRMLEIEKEKRKKYVNTHKISTDIVIEQNSSSKSLPIKNQNFPSLPKPRYPNSPISINASKSTNVSMACTLSKPKKHVWTPSGYVSPAIALKRHSKMDIVKGHMKGWGLKTSKGDFVWRKMDGMGKIFDL